MTLRSASCASSCMMNLSTTRLMTSTGRWPKGTMASRRLRNSGANSRLIASLSSRSRRVRVKPIGVRARSCAPAFVVMMRMTLRKSICLAVVVGQLPVVHDLQQDVVEIGMRLLDFVEQQHAMRMLVDGVGQQAALIEADIAGRRADQPAHRVALHIFRHVEAHELDAERCRELARGFRLADAGRAGEEIAADRLLADRAGPRARA